jgi:hypothetical protein
MSNNILNNLLSKYSFSTKDRKTLEKIFENLVELGNPSKNLTANGNIDNSISVGESVVAMQLLNFNGTSWELADASTNTKSKGMLGISLQTANSGYINVALGLSNVRNDSWNWTPGAILYVSLTAGGITETAPSATDEVVRIIGHAKTSKIITFNPSNDYITLN